MSAQVTEAHIARARASGYTTDKVVQMAAQFIANNEASKAERDQIRAGVERLTAACDKFSNDEITQGDWKARAERAEAELATERARLRQIALDACRSAKITPIVWYPKRYAIDPNDFGIINEQQVEACAQAIDAAMKEGA